MRGKKIVRKGRLSTWPSSSPHISCLLSFFKGNLFLDISKTHLKAIFTLWLQPSPPAPLPLRQSYPPSHVAPDVSQSPFLGSQHSFDLIRRAICNPLQDTEARSPTPHLYISLSICLSFPLLSQDPTLSAVPRPPTYPPVPAPSLPLWDCQHISYMLG